MGLNLSRSFAFVSAITAAQTSADLGSQLVQLARRFGFSSVFGGLVPRRRKPKGEIAPLTLVQHVPAEWAERYNDRGYLFHDPVFHRLQTDPQPFTWTNSYGTHGGAADRKIVGDEAAAFGLNDGFVVPVITLDERIAAVSFGGGRGCPILEDAAKLSFAAHCAIGRFLQFQAKAGELRAQLTPRERECLLWSSEGKTEADIGIMLGVSTSTISKHIAAARDKLHAVNKAHAVAIGIRLNVL